MTTDSTIQSQPVTKPVSQQHFGREPWNKGKLIGQKPPLKLKEVWEIRIRLQMAKRSRELALFNLAVDSKLRSCDLVNLKVRDVAHGVKYRNGRWSSNKRPSSRYSSKSPSEPALLFWAGYRKPS